MIPRVVDISHHNVVDDLKETAAAGIWGIIHKASQGRAYRDPMYTTRRRMAADASLLFGAYHFLTGDPVQLQFNNFCDAAQVAPSDLIAVDYEPNRLSQPNIHILARFCRLVELKFGRKCVIYSGNLLKETIARASADERNYLRGHRLWLAEYGGIPRLPMGWTSAWLWQYTGDNIGPEPHRVDGIAGDGIDLNTFAGTEDELRAQWAQNPQSAVA